MKRDIKVASVQFNHHAGDKAYNLSVIEHYVQQAADSGVEIISFPEICRETK
ncbi:Aliphatic amidase amiE [Vibrio chagasii]|nr:Aliphatic amidase amiE [Vibrio chagasii]